MTVLRLRHQELMADKSKIARNPRRGSRASPARGQATGGQSQDGGGQGRDDLLTRLASEREDCRCAGTAMN